jgi:hypothetical protein
MHNLPVPLSALAVASLVALASSRLFPGVIGGFRRAFQPLEDQWTWTTADGIEFEDVEVDAIEANQVIFHHKFGSERVPIDSLSDTSRQTLFRGFPFADSAQNSMSSHPISA